uniref:DNA polymerase IV n=1 Tax=Lygus hesperus TaxID=30085 RepID=A0A0A9W751_LYGHE
MSSIAVEISPSQHPAVLQHTEIMPPRMNRSSDVAPSISLKDEEPLDDIIGSPEIQPSTSEDKEQRKKAGFNLKKTAMNVVSGMKRKKKGLGEDDERSKSHEELSTDIGDQANPDKGKLKNISFNKMLNTFSHPSQKFNKMWSSLNKTFSSTSNQVQFNELSETRSTMTLGRFFGKKRDTVELPPMKEERKAQTLGRMFNFKSPAKKQTQSVAGVSVEKD